MLIGMTWSFFHDPRTGQVFQQYPLRNDEAVVVGMPVLALAAAFGVAALALYFRRGIAPGKLVE
jgi:hypothetical protein